MTRKMLQGLLVTSLALSLNTVAYADEVKQDDASLDMVTEYTETVDATVEAFVSESEEGTEVVLEEGTEAVLEEETEAVEEEFDNSPVTAKVSKSQILVNGEEIPMGAYAIGGSTYVKITDLAFSLAGTASAFDVVWSRERNGFEFTTGKNFFIEKYLYEMLDDENKEVERSSLKNYKKNATLDVVSYVIDGNSYFRLSEMSELLQFSLGWDQEEKVVAINTTVLG